jgi:protein O-GlcNAc transferase
VDIGSELRLGVALQQQGRPLDAEHVFDRVLEHDPKSFDALHMLGIIAAQTGRSTRAVDLITRAISRNDKVAAAHHHLGLALKSLGRLDEAVGSLRRAIALRPDMAVAHANLSAVLIDLKRFDEALDGADRALALRRDSAPAQLNRAAALQGLGRVADALEACDQALMLQENHVVAWSLRGDILLQLNSAPEALGSYQRALALAPDSAEAWAGCGAAFLRLDRANEAVACYERALRQRPACAAWHANCGAAHLALRRPEEALARCEQAVRCDPELFEAHYNRGEALQALHRHRAALAAYERAIALRPDSSAAHCARGHACREMNEPSIARESYRRALKIEPDNPAARLGLVLATIAVVPGTREAIDRSRAELAVELARLDTWLSGRHSPDEPSIVGMAQPFYLAYQDRANKELLVRWGTLAARLMARWASRLPRPPDSAETQADSPVRVGVVTAHACEHSVFRALLKGWLEHWDRDRIRVSVFYLGRTQDAATQVARANAEFIDCSAHSLSESVEEVRKRHIEVLIYPEIGMDTVTLQLASLRLAPHQIVAWGHPETSGLPTIDYFVSAEAFEPADAEQFYSEKLVRLPGIGCYYEPCEFNGAVNLDSLGVTGDVPLLLCAGTPYKYAAEHDDVLLEIARGLGRCRLVFFEASHETLSAKVQRRLQARFRDGGLDPNEYLLMIPWLPQEAFFGLLRRADVYLDTLGFSGFNTVMQALECDLPVVAYEGRFMRGRFASGILRCLGLDELVASTSAEYVHKALALARDERLRDRVRVRLRSHRHSLYRNRAAVEALTGFIVSLPPLKALPSERKVNS